MNSNRILSATIVPVFHLFSALICIFFSNELVNKIYFEDYSDVAYFLSMSVGVYSLFVSVILRSIYVYSKDILLIISLEKKIDIKAEKRWKIGTIVAESIRLLFII